MLTDAVTSTASGSANEAGGSSIVCERCPPLQLAAWSKVAAPPVIATPFLTVHAPGVPFRSGSATTPDHTQAPASGR